MGLPLRLYQVLRPILARDPVRSAQLEQPKSRPSGSFVWLHAPMPRDISVVCELIIEFSDMRPDIWFIITTESSDAPELPDNCFYEIVPRDHTDDVETFLTRWKPDLMCWLSGTLRPELIHQTAKQKIAMFLLDTGSAIEAARGFSLWPGLRRATLDKFQHTLVGDKATEDAMKSAGILADHIEVAGVLERSDDVILCNESERDTIAKLLNSRPVWLASGINVAEIEPILATHRQALRRSHRLLLVLVPEDPEDAVEFVAALARSEFEFSQRSIGEDPEADTQIYLADTTDEMGLWYRLSAVSFIGQTLAGRSGSGPDPFDAAALGSVVIHGPGLTPHQDGFRRLARAGASMQVSHSGELALAVEALLAPDKAAEMAHAAWQISTAGAEVIERVIELMGDALDARAASK